MTLRAKTPETTPTNQNEERLPAGVQAVIYLMMDGTFTMRPNLKEQPRPVTNDSGQLRQDLLGRTGQPGGCRDVTAPSCRTRPEERPRTMVEYELR